MLACGLLRSLFFRLKHPSDGKLPQEDLLVAGSRADDGLVGVEGCTATSS